MLGSCHGCNTYTLLWLTTIFSSRTPDWGMCWRRVWPRSLRLQTPLIFLEVPSPLMFREVVLAALWLPASHWVVTTRSLSSEPKKRQPHSSLFCSSFRPGSQQHTVVYWLFGYMYKSSCGPYNLFVHASILFYSTLPFFPSFLLPFSIFPFFLPLMSSTPTPRGSPSTSFLTHTVCPMHY